MVGVHGVGGTWGALATGLFAIEGDQRCGRRRPLAGNPGQLWTQIVAVLATYALAIVGTFVILKVVDVLVGLRVTDGGRGGRSRPLAALRRRPTRSAGGSYSEYTQSGGAFARACDRQRRRSRGRRTDGRLI